MTRLSDGGPAFPCPNDARTAEMGMSLRDWFAGLAMQSSIIIDAINDCTHRLKNADADCDTLNPTDVAIDAYAYADAMLAQGRKSTQSPSTK